MSSSTHDLNSPVSAVRLQAVVILAGVAFFLSGFSALVYQVSWQRILALHTGVGIYSLALIVGSFMAGLGIGSFAGGWMSSRISPRTAFLGFSVLELAVAAMGATSCLVYYDWLYQLGSSLYSRPLLAGLLHFSSLLPPTALMGMSLPFLVRATVADVQGAGRTIGYLYAINVLGASIGALASPWVLIRLFGIRGAVWNAVAANLLAAGIALLLVRCARKDTLRDQIEDSTVPTSARDQKPFPLWMVLYATSGFCAMSLEILWFRVVDLAAKTMAFSFGSVLSIYLMGNAIGAFLGVGLVHRITRPLRTFLLLQIFILMYSGSALLLLVVLPPDTPYFNWFYDYWGQARAFLLVGSPFTATAFKLYFVLPVLLFGPPTILMGLSFPILQRAVQDEVRTSGQKVGFLQAANITGSVLGTVMTGILLLNWLGTSGSVRLLLLCGLLFAALGIRYYGPRSVFTGGAVALTLLVFLVPGQGNLWHRLHGVEKGTAIISEDATGVAALVPEGSLRYRVYVNGKSHSWLPFGGSHTKLGALPAVVHSAPRDVAIIGLGSGDTAWAAGLRQETRSVTVFEIAGPQPRVLEQLSQSFESNDNFMRLRAFLDDPRVRIEVADGRKALEYSNRRFDVIQADALNPRMAYSGNVYSREFFELCSRRLKPGGIMCTWAPTPRVSETFRSVFHYVLEIEGGGILLGSNELVRIQRGLWRERIVSRRTVSYLGSRSYAQIILEAARTIKKARTDRNPSMGLNFDLFPRDEFITP